MAFGCEIARKVMNDGVALLLVDAAATDPEFNGIDSIVAQNVRSVICAPLLTESTVHGAIYADRLDPWATFKAKDIQLMSAVAAFTGIAVQIARTRERLDQDAADYVSYGRLNSKSPSTRCSRKNCRPEAQSVLKVPVMSMRSI